MTTDPRIRIATADDAGEILRLAYLMWEEIGIRARPGDWEVAYQKVFADEVDGPRMRGFVADHPDKPGTLIACGVAWTYQLLPAFWLVEGKMGYLQWFYTDRSFRSQGLATAILDTSVAWLVEQGCTRIHLHSAPAAEGLYRKSGFEDTDMANLWFRIHRN